MACHLDSTKPLSEPILDIVNLTLRNKLQWNFNQNSNTFIQENALESVVWEMASISSWPQCVNFWIKISSVVNTMPADDLVTPRARVSAAMILTWFFLVISHHNHGIFGWCAWIKLMDFVPRYQLCYSESSLYNIVILFCRSFSKENWSLSYIYMSDLSLGYHGGIPIFWGSYWPLKY